jgi:hypothetical protein
MAAMAGATDSEVAWSLLEGGGVASLSQLAWTTGDVRVLANVTVAFARLAEKPQIREPLVQAGGARALVGLCLDENRGSRVRANATMALALIATDARARQWLLSEGGTAVLQLLLRLSSVQADPRTRTHALRALALLLVEPVTRAQLLVPPLSWKWHDVETDFGDGAVVATDGARRRRRRRGRRGFGITERLVKLLSFHDEQHASGELALRNPATAVVAASTKEVEAAEGEVDPGYLSGEDDGETVFLSDVDPGSETEDAGATAFQAVVAALAALSNYSDGRMKLVSSAGAVA